MFFYSLPTLDFRIIFCILQKLVKEGGLSWIVISHYTNYLLNWSAKVFDRIESFNRGRMPKDGKYVISMPTLYRPYYGFWRIFSD